MEKNKQVEEWYDSLPKRMYRHPKGRDRLLTVSLRELEDYITALLLEARIDEHKRVDEILFRDDKSEVELYTEAMQYLGKRYEELQSQITALTDKEGQNGNS